MEGGRGCSSSLLCLVVLLRVLCVSPASAVDLSREEQDYLRKKGTIVFASQTRYPPFEFVDKNGQHEGMVLDVVRWLAVEMGFQPVFTDTTFQKAKRTVLSGKADILTSLFYSDKRKEAFAFTSALYEVPASIFVRAERTDIKDLQDLNGKTIAMQAGDYAKDFLESKNIKFEVFETKDFADATDMVIAGRADAVIGDEQIVLYHIFSNRLIEMIKKVGDPLYTGRDCMAASKANARLISILNKGIEEARTSGVLDKIGKKWLGTRLTSRESAFQHYFWPLFTFTGGILLLSLWVWAWNVRLRVVVREKTEDIQRSEEALRESEQTLRGILTASPVAISMGQGRTISWINEAWAKMFRLGTTLEHVGRDSRILYPSQAEYERVGDVAYNGLENDRVNEIDVEFIRSDGSIFDGHMRVTSFDGQDPGNGVIVACSDISDRKRAERAVKDSEQRLAQIINFLPDATFVIDIDGRVVAWNRAIEELTGVKAAGILGKGDYEYSLAFYPERRPVLIDLVNRRDPNAESSYAFLREDGDILVCETRPGTLKLEGIHLWKAARPLYDAQGTVVGAIESIRDITELKRTQELLLQTERFKAVADLAGGVAHNFNNLLQIIIGGTQLVLLGLQTRNLAGVEPTLERILEGCKFGAETVKRLQSFAGIQAGDKESTEEIFDVSEVVRQAAEMTKPWWKTNPERDGIVIRLELKLEDGCLVKGRKNELFEVVVNLIKNAAEAVPRGGDIEVETFVVDEQVALHVRDTGVGMGEKDLKRVFNPFFTTKVQVGTGLGLATTRQTIERHGGVILVDSIKGRGTVFKISLPLASVSPESPPPGGREDPERETTILLIDDMEPVLEMLRIGLSARNYPVLTAMSGSEGLDIFKAKSVDVVICDLGMPGMNGWQVCQAMKDYCLEKGIPKPPFIVLTGWAGQEADQDKMAESGVDTVVGKPCAVEDLRGLVHKLVTEHRAHG